MGTPLESINEAQECRRSWKAFLSEDAFQVFFRSADRGNAVVFNKVVQHIRRDKGRERGTEPDILDAEIQKRQQDTHCLLFVPGKNHGKREFVDAAAESLRQSDCNTDRAVRIVALSHVHNAGQSSDRTDVQVIEPVLSACQSQDDGICGSLLYELGVIVSSGLRAIAAADKEEVADRAALYSVDDRIRNAEDCAVAESRGDGRSAIDPGELGILSKAAQFESFLDNGGEILVLAEGSQIPSAGSARRCRNCLSDEYTSEAQDTHGQGASRHGYRC